jgi:hypothetical protein
MRVSSRSLLGIAFILFVGHPVAPAQQPAPEPVPELDVAISVGKAHQSSTELLGRATPGAVYSTVSVQEPGGHAIYFQSVSFSLGPDSTEQAVKQVSGLTFNLSASSSSRTKLVRTEVVVSRGSHVVARYRAVSDFPLSRSASQ